MIKETGKAGLILRPGSGQVMAESSLDDHAARTRPVSTSEVPSMCETLQQAIAVYLHTQLTERMQRFSTRPNEPFEEIYRRLLEVDRPVQALADLLGIPWPTALPAPWRTRRPALPRQQTSQPLVHAAPYHVSAPFLCLPERWRWEFLRRNPEVIALLAYMGQVHQMAGVLKHLIGLPYEPEDPCRPHVRSQPTPRSEEVVSLWQLVHRSGWRLARVLEERFGICFSGPCLHAEHLGPPSDFCGLKRGLDPREWSDLWLDTFWVHQGDLERQKAVLTAWEGFVQQNFKGWEDPRVGRSRTWDKLTKRQQRDYRPRFNRICHGSNSPRFRQLGDDYYNRLLAAWDAREGWTGEGYDPRLAVKLQLALYRAKGSVPDVYYQAFRLITGETDTGIAWDIHFGAYVQALHPEAYRRLRAMPRRRRAGRRRGSVSRVSRIPRPGEVPLPEDVAQAGDPEVEASINRLYQLLDRGVSVQDAIVEAELPDWLTRTLLAPENARQVEAWASRQRSP
jgi:hypothetical protein